MCLAFVLGTKDALKVGPMINTIWSAAVSATTTIVLFCLMELVNNIIPINKAISDNL